MQIFFMSHYSLCIMLGMKKRTGKERHYVKKEKIYHESLRYCILLAVTFVNSILMKKFYKRKIYKKQSLNMKLRTS